MVSKGRISIRLILQCVCLFDSCFHLFIRLTHNSRDFVDVLIRTDGLNIITAGPFHKGNRQAGFVFKCFKFKEPLIGTNKVQ